MGALKDIHVLQWEMDLSEEGYTTFTLKDQTGLRWGWVINAATSGWTAHVGAWAPVKIEGIEEKIMHCDDPAYARSWVEQEIARQWKAHARKDKSDE